MKPEDVRKVGVVGCGIMGSGIVEVCAKAGLDVTFVEADEMRRERGQQSIERSLAKAVERGKLDPAGRDEALGRITGSTDPPDLADADLIIEAVTEDLDIKLDVFRRLDELVRLRSSLSLAGPSAQQAQVVIDQQAIQTRMNNIKNAEGSRP